MRHWSALLPSGLLQGQAESQALLNGFRAVVRVAEGKRKAVACPDPSLCPRQDMWQTARVKLPNGWGSKGIDVRLFGCSAVRLFGCSAVRNSNAGYAETFKFDA